MELYCNNSNRMTRWLVSSGALKTSFILVDIGVQGGISPRWNALQDHLIVYGFDLLEEAIAPLVEVGNARRHYFVVGLADQDGELDIVVPANRYETQLYSAQPGERRRVQVRRLDTLFNDGEVPPADFIKMDCEGYEPIVLRGAKNYLAACNLVGADTESNFNLSSVIPDTHFSACCEPLVHQRLMVFDIQFNRIPVIDMERPAGIHRPATLNVLFARNLPQEQDSPESFAHRPPQLPMDPQTVLKTAIVFESYGLLDWSLYVLRNFSTLIGAAVDVDRAISELKAGATMKQSISWRITAPMRAARRFFLK